MRRFIAKNIGFGLQDMFRGTYILETLKLLKESQYWDESRIQEYQIKKLKLLIDYSSKNVPYYEKLFSKIKLNSKDIVKIEDVSKIPILTKDIVLVHNKELISRQFNKKNVKIGRTGGTTGTPIIIYKDTHNRSFTWASYYRWFEWMGLNYYDSVASFWGTPSVLNNSARKNCLSKITSLLQNTILIDSFNLNEEGLASAYSIIMSRKPLLLKGYLSSVLNFANYIEKNSLKVPNFNAISTTTETLLPIFREYIEKIFSVPVFDQYGCGEISAISYECNKHNGLHINQEHIICETLDDNGKAIYNTPSPLVATDLDNLVMPFIRYENGDIVTLTDEKCTCGVNQPLMRSIEGRSTDTVILRNGSRVHGVFFTGVFYELGIMSTQIRRFQIIQEKSDSILLQLEVVTPLLKADETKISNALTNFIDKVEIKQVDRLFTEANGKFRYIINKVVSK